MRDLEKAGKCGRRAVSVLLAALLLSLPGCFLRVSTGEEGENPETNPGVLTPDTTPSTEKPGESGETSGVLPPETTGTDTETTAPPPDTERESEPLPDVPSYTSPLLEAGGKNWSYRGGKFVYTLPERDESGLKTYDELDSISKKRWSDAPDDWFGGQWRYDEETGESTLLWQRANDTMASLRNYGAIYVGDPEKKAVYLTFDGGYESGYTTILLDLFREKHVPAAFFFDSYYLRVNPDLVKRMIDEGHIVGNHSSTHLVLPDATKETVKEQLGILSEQFEKAFPDAPQMIYFRPPSGNCSDWLLAAAKKLGYTTVMYSWTYYDYDDKNQPDPEWALEKVKKGLHPGAVYMFHMTSATSAEIMPEFIDWIRAQGYEFLPICDLEP